MSGQGISVSSESIGGNEHRQLPSVLFTVMLTLLCAVGIYLRVYRLETVPGLEHDESLILLGARAIGTSGAIPLSGDKTYEGPLAEVLVHMFFRIFGEGVWQGRLVITICNIMLFLITYLTARQLFPGKLPGFVALLFLVFSPWHLFASRVLYACNLVPCLYSGSMLLFLLFLKTGGIRYLAVSGALLGLSMHGHVYTVMGLVIFGICFILYGFPSVSHRKSTVFLVFFIIFLLFSSPLWIYQIHEGFPVLNRLQSRAENSVQVPFNVFSAYILTFLKTLGGKDFWTDFETDTSIILILPVLCVFGASIVYITVHGDQRLRKSLVFILLWIAIPCIVVPATVPQHFVNGSSNPQPPPPHYLDVIFPAPYVLLAVFFSFLFKQGKKRIPVVLLLVILVGIQVYIQQSMFFSVFAREGGRGRWKQDIQNIAGIILKDPVHEDAVYFTGSYFGGGYPQLKFLLPGKNILPSLFQPPPGIYSSGNFIDPGQEPETRFVHVISNGVLLPETVPYKAQSRRLLPSGEWYMYSYGSPGIKVYLRFPNRDLFRYQGPCSAAETGIRTGDFNHTGTSKRYRIHVTNRTDQVRSIRQVPENIALSDRYKTTVNAPAQTHWNWDYYYGVTGFEATGTLDGWDSPGIWTLQVSQMEQKVWLRIEPGYENFTRFQEHDIIIW